MNANDPSLIIFLSPFSTVRHPFFLTTNNIFIFHVLPVVFIIYRLKEIYFLCQKPWLVSRRIGIESIQVDLARSTNRKQVAPDCREKNLTKSNKILLP